MTMMACPDVDVDEKAFVKIFGLADNYALDGDTLYLNSSKKGTIAVFEAVYFH
jgi:heat shock protein HslJ